MNIRYFVCFLMAFSLLYAHGEDSKVKEIKPSADQTHHLEVKPQSLEGYRIPYMAVNVTIIDQETKEKKTVTLHPMFGGNFHYGVNVALKPKKYLLQFHLDAPTFAREGARENQWLGPVEAEFLFDATKFEEKIGNKTTKDMIIFFETEHAEEMFILEGTEKEHDAKDQKAAEKKEDSTTVIYVALLILGVIIGFFVSKFIAKK